MISGNCGYLNTDIHPLVSRHGSNKYIAQVDYIRTVANASFTDDIPLHIVGKWK